MSTTGTDETGRARRPGLLHLGADGGDVGASVPKLATGIPGFDEVAMGGLPARRATVVAGQAGSVKTVFAGQFLAEGVRLGQPGVFVTLEEPAGDLRANLATIGIDVAPWEAAGAWRFVDASRLSTSSGPAPHNLETLVAQIGHAVDATGADRLVLDSLNGVLALQEDPALARQLLRSLLRRPAGDGPHRRAHRRDARRPGRHAVALRRRGVLRRQRRAAAQRAGGRLPPAHRRGARDERRRAPQG